MMNGLIMSWVMSSVAYLIMVEDVLEYILQKKNKTIKKSYVTQGKDKKR